jgi:TPR repeat protein
MNGQPDLFSNAVDLGNRQLYEGGKGVRQNSTEAAYWYQKSAEQGNPDAALSLGSLHFFGTGVPQNDAKALYWVGSAACYGLPEAKSFLEFVIKPHPGGLQPTPPATPQNTNSLGTTVAQDLQAYKACLHQYPEETSKCDALEKAYKADLELFRAVLGVAR